MYIYVYASAFVVYDILNAGVEVKALEVPALFAKIREMKSDPRYIPLGWLQFCNYFGRLLWYKHLVESGECDEDLGDPDFLVEAVGPDALTLVKAFKVDDMRFGEETTRVFDEVYAGNPMFITPFAGPNRPKTPEDWAVLGFGLSAAVRLYKDMFGQLAD